MRKQAGRILQKLGKEKEKEQWRGRILQKRRSQAGSAGKASQAKEEGGGGKRLRCAWEVEREEGDYYYYSSRI